VGLKFSNRSSYSWVSPKQDQTKHGDEAGLGHGYVDVFSSDGVLLQRFTERYVLDSPWGVARAPVGFGPLSGLILVGNFGNGSVNAFDKEGRLRGLLRDTNGSPIIIPGLWALTFGGGLASTPQTLYFTAGIDHETHGLFGSIVPEAQN